MVVSLLANVWMNILSVVVAVLILLMMVTVHEFGHYIVGKIFKFKINEFSIGFGPAILKYTNKKSGELFAVRIIPLGGYCAFEGEESDDEGYTRDKNDKNGQNGNNANADKKDSFANDASNDKNANDATSDNTGKDINIKNQSRDDVKSETFKNASDISQDVKESLSAEKINADKEISVNVNGEKTDKNNSDLYSELDDIPKKEKKKSDPNSFNNKKPWQRILVLIAGATMNYLLAVLLIIISFSIYGQMLYYTAEISAPDVDLNISYEYCLQNGDVILEAEGRNVYNTSDLMNVMEGKKAGEIVEFRLSRKVGERFDEDKKENVAVREIINAQIKMRVDCDFKNVSDANVIWQALGINQNTNEETQKEYYQIYVTNFKFGFFETIGRSFEYSFNIAGSIFKVIGQLFTGRLGVDTLGGPITTISMTSQIVSRGFQYFLEISAYIGVNLAVFNLLPIPALDGSKVIFTAIEWVRGKPINRKVENIIHFVGLVLLFGFAIFVDLLQLF